MQVMTILIVISYGIGSIISVTLIVKVEIFFIVCFCLNLRFRVLIDGRLIRFSIVYMI